MIKIGGGFWPFWAGKRAVFDSEVLATLLKEEVAEVRANISDKTHEEAGGRLEFHIFDI